MNPRNYPTHTEDCTHPRPITTSYFGGSDRVVKTFDKALELALKRAPEHGRQMIHRHTGWLLKNVWVVQDVQDA